MDAEKSRDKELLADALAREKALEDIEEAERQARRREVIELQAYYKKSAEDKEAYERAVDAVRRVRSTIGRRENVREC